MPAVPYCQLVDFSACVKRRGGMRSGKNYRPTAKMFDSGERLKINLAADK
jgi:hypothetical protein